MRKLLWCGVAASVFGVLGTGYLFWHQPDTLPGRCLHKANEFGMTCSSLAVGAHAVSTPKSEEPVADSHKCDVPANEPSESVPSGDESESLTRQMIAILNPPESGGGPAPIVIHEEDETPLPEPMMRLDDEQVLQMLRPLTSELTTGLPCVETEPMTKEMFVPPLMPHADEEYEEQPSDCGKTAPPMPYADDDGDEHLTFWYEVGYHGYVDDFEINVGSWLDSVMTQVLCDCYMHAASKSCCHILGASDDSCHWWVKMVVPALSVETPQGGYEQSEPKDEEMPTPPHGDPYSEYHHSYCPYSGRSCPEPYHHSEPMEDEVKLEKKNPTFIDIVKSLLPMSIQTPSADTPAHPEVDTMEFRPSDFHLEDLFGPIPF
jgi:hypothetical protein